MGRQQTGQHPDERQGQAALLGGGDSPPLAGRGVGFFAVCLAYCAIILDGSVLNVAIPTIRDRLGSSMAGAQWVLDAYTLPLAALLLTAGAVGDRIGRDRGVHAGLGGLRERARRRLAHRGARGAGGGRGRPAARHLGPGPAPVHAAGGP
jgi:DHA2 family methylenomycin A resistance protein-like MFS transporter